MKYTKDNLIFLLFFTLSFLSCGIKNPERELKYPVTRKVDTTDIYFGVSVADPYRWLEDDHSDETKEWVDLQNQVTAGYLDSIPFRSTVRERLKKLWNYERISAPFKKKNLYFFYKNNGLQNQSVLYVKDGLNGNPRVFIDPNTFSPDGTTALTQLAVSEDARFAAYSIAKGGSDWEEIFVLDIQKNTLLKDHIEWVKFSSVGWSGDGFFYSRYDSPVAGEELLEKNENHQVFYHTLGEEQSHDRLVYKNTQHPLRNYSLIVTHNQRYAILYESETTSGEGISYIDLTRKDTLFKPIAPGFEYEYQVIDNFDNLLLVKTNQDAPRYKLVMIDPEKPDKSNWKTIVPEKEEVLEDVAICNNLIVGTYMKDAYNRLYVFNPDGKIRNEISLPGICSVQEFHSTKEDSIAFFGCFSYTFPNTVYQYNINSNRAEVYFNPEVDFKKDEYVTKQVFYPSKDGTKIPMFITHKKDIKLNGKNPAWLYGYGGFNISNLPQFKTDRLVWLENGGIYAVANIRGGGEYGEEWHAAGTKLQKQNVFDDFIAASEFLIKENYTTSSLLAISGRSNGGLLVGACMTQRPELFKVALPGVGVLDMLRFHKFTIGWAWVGDYGSSDDSLEFHSIYSYSPLHNIKEDVEYPATLVTTADHDDRVVPLHSFKFISTLQEKYQGNNPVLIRIETMAGHGSGKPIAKLIEEDTDVLSFMFFNLGVIPYPESSMAELKE